MQQAILVLSGCVWASVALAQQPGGGSKLFVDDVEVAQVKVKRTMGYRISLDETFDIGMDAGEPVSEEYHVPFDFTGEIGKVVVKLGTGD